MIGAGIPTVAEGIKKEFARIGINAFKRPTLGGATAFQPVTAYAYRKTAVIKAVFIVPTSRLYFESSENLRSTEK